MGMAASQARYLALTGRMNDIEYQGQQINQQRTTLSTQINELYNSLLDMSVPTPPSQTDFSKTVYSGTLGATKFTMGTVRPTGNDNYNIDLKFSMSGDAVTKTNRSKSLVENTPTLMYADAKTEAINKVFKTEDVTTYTAGEAVTAVPEDNESDDQNIMIKTTVGAAKDLKYVEFADKAGKGIESLKGLDDNLEIYVITNISNIKEGTDCAGLLTKNPEDDAINNVFETTSTTETIIGAPKIGYGSLDSDEQNQKIINLGFYTYDGDPGKDTEPVLITNLAELKRAIDENNPIVKQSASGDTPLKNESYQDEACGYLVKNGNNVTPLYSLESDKNGNNPGADMILACGVDISNVVAGLRHSFNLSETEYPTDDDVLKLFSVYVAKSESGENTPYFIQNKDYESVIDGKYVNIPSYEYNASGTYTHAKPTDNCKLEFDATGRITKIGIPNNGDYDWVELSVSTETDQEAYEEAMKEFNYEKIKYDKRQEEINLKTSIVQQQDKNLELKLTRLDNERNALNTELEAVKKVVNDNIEKTYKTFNG